MDRTQFTFYESFYKALVRIRKGADRALAYDAIVRYALYAEDPDLDKLPDAVAIAFEVIKPTLKASRKKSEAGRAGGEAKRKQTESKPEANASKAEAKRKQEQVQEQVQVQDKEEEQMLYSYSSPPAGGEERGRPSGRFVPPTAEEVAEQIRAKGYRVDPEAFVAFYASKGWKVGNSPMKDWKAALVTWEKREQDRKPRGPAVCQTVETDQGYAMPTDMGDLDWLLEELKKEGDHAS